MLKGAFQRAATSHFAHKRGETLVDQQIVEEADIGEEKQGWKGAVGVGGIAGQKTEGSSREVA